MPVMLNALTQVEWEIMEDRYRRAFRRKFERRLRWSPEPDAVFIEVFGSAFAVAKNRLLPHGTTDEFPRMLWTVTRNQAESKRRKFERDELRAKRIKDRFEQKKKQIIKVVGELQDFRLQILNADFASRLIKLGHANGGEFVRAILIALTKEEDTFKLYDVSTPSRLEHYEVRVKTYQVLMKGRNHFGIRPLDLIRVSREYLPQMPQTAWDQLKFRFFKQDLPLLRRLCQANKQESEAVYKLQSLQRKNKPPQRALRPVRKQRTAAAQAAHAPHCLDLENPVDS